MVKQPAKLRVAFIDQTGDESGGAQESFAILLNHLPDWIDARVVLFHDGKYAERLRRQGCDVSVLSVSGELASSKREHPSFSGVIAMPGTIARMTLWLRQQEIDVVYTHTVKAHFVGAPAARMAGIRCVMHLRDILEGAPLTALKAVCRMCSRERIAISHAVARAYGLSKTSVVLNPLDLEAYGHVPAREEASRRLGLTFDPAVPTIGIVGRINRWKGHDRFLRIAAAVRERANARFLIVGSAIFRDADFETKLRDMARELNIESNVLFLPWIDDVRDVYAVLDVHANCSDREPFGRSVIEAAACGVPTVCFSDAGVSETIDDGVDGRVVLKGDEAAFADALTDLVLRRDALTAMRRRARQLARRFDATRHATKVASILRRAAA